MKGFQAQRLEEEKKVSYSASKTAPELALVTNALYCFSHLLVSGLTIGLKRSLLSAISSNVSLVV